MTKYDGFLDAKQVIFSECTAVTKLVYQNVVNGAYKFLNGRFRLRCEIGWVLNVLCERKIIGWT